MRQFLMHPNSSKYWMLFRWCENNNFSLSYRGPLVYVGTYSFYTLVTPRSASCFGHHTPRIHQAVRRVVTRTIRKQWWKKYLFTCRTSNSGHLGLSHGVCWINKIFRRSECQSVDGYVCARKINFFERYIWPLYLVKLYKSASSLHWKLCSLHARHSGCCFCFQDNPPSKRFWRWCIYT
jgi:hypothetical protein